MKVIKVNDFKNLPKNYTGIAEYPNGEKEWWLNGERHKTDGPAIEYPNGTKHWFLNGKRHREVGPCTLCKDCLEGNFELCSKPGPAVEYSNGEKEWYLNGKLHRTDGPAVECPDGTKEWFLNGKRHRTDGPAIELPHGTKEYCLNGEFLNKDKINQLINLGYPTETAIKLTYYLETEKQ